MQCDKEHSLELEYYKTSHEPIGMIAPTKLSPMTNYYVRRLCEHSNHCLLRLGKEGNTTESDRLDLELILKELYSSKDQIASIIQELEFLVQFHKGLVAKNAKPDEIETVEQHIFKLFGADAGSRTPDASSLLQNEVAAAPPLTLAKVLELFNYLRETSNLYLGPVITDNYLKSSRPNCEWVKQFQINRSEPISYDGDLSIALSSDQIQWSQTWVDNFVQCCSQILIEFPKFIDQEELKPLQLSSNKGYKI